MLPTVAPALRAHLNDAEADRRDQRRAHARLGLPDPRMAAARVVLAVCEVEAGQRPVAQLERVCHHTLYHALAARIRRGGGPAVTSRSLVDALTQEHTPGLVQVVVLVRRGPRVAAIALELDAAPGHWQVVELQY